MTRVLTTVIVAGLLLPGASRSADPLCIATGSGGIPSIPWVERSDWVNVKTNVTPRASGNGTTDDTAAIQKALDLIGERPGTPKVVYLPPGTYRITHSLHLTNRNGGMLVGHGRDTRIVWDGKKGGRMFWSNGAARHSYIGLVWDGAGKAAVGIDHDSKTLYETRVMHEHMEFHGFTGAAIRIGHNQKLASAEMLFSNLKFENNKIGVLFQSWNDYNNVFDGCHFLNNHYGIRAEKGNVTVRNSRFEGSSASDLFLSTHSHSIRRVVSEGSYSFIRTVRGPISNGLIKVEDVRVNGWQNPEGAIISELRGPVHILDSVFSRPPSLSAPIRLDNPWYMNQIAIVANVTSSETRSIVDRGSNGTVYDLTAARRPPPLLSANQTFLRDKLFTSERVLDAKQDCGAKGDGVSDDFQVLQDCFDQAQSTSAETVVYFPSGTYVVSRTLTIGPGARYRVDGTGWHSRILWQGKRAGTVLHVQDPDGLTVQHLAFGGPPGTTTLLHTGVRPSTARYHNIFGYHDDETKDVRIIFDGLPRGAVVAADHMDGRVLIRNSSEATLLFGFLVSVQMTVEGTTPRNGYLGVLSRTSSQEDFPLVVRDSQSITMTDWYNEQTRRLVLLEGNTNDTGRVILDHSQAATEDTEVARIDGYRGRLAHIGGMFGRSMENRSTEFFISGGRADLDLVLLGNMFWHQPPTDSPSSAKLQRLGNSINRKGLGPNAIVEDAVTEGRDAQMIEVFDALRTLGEFDLTLNYCLSAPKQ